MISRISILDYALIADDVYSSDEPSNHTILKLEQQGWERLSLSFDPPSNAPFFARLYLKSCENNQYEVVIGIRGTILTHLQNDVSDLNMAILHWIPAEFTDALTYMHHVHDFLHEHYPESALSLTGHSLGGAIAKLIAVKTHLVAVAFNAPGIANLRGIHIDNDTKTLIYNINTRKDSIHAVGQSIGHVFNVFSQAGQSHFDRANQLKSEHSMSPSEGIATAILRGMDELDGRYAQHRIDSLVAALKKDPKVAYRHIQAVGQ